MKKIKRIIKKQIIKLIPFKTTEDFFKIMLSEISEAIQRDDNRIASISLLFKLGLTKDSDLNEIVGRVSSYIRERIKYKREPTGKEFLYTDIKHFLDLDEGQAITEDCDGTALLTAVIFKIIGDHLKRQYKVFLRFASHKKHGILHHAYTVLKTQSGREIIIDLVRPTAEALPITNKLEAEIR